MEQCRWYLLCTNQAVFYRESVGFEVPICESCDEKAQKDMGSD